MDNKHIIVLGGNILNGGVVAKKEKYNAKNALVVDWNENPAIKGDIFYQHDIKDAEDICRYLDKNGINDIAFAYTSVDLAVSTQRAIHKKYGLCVPSPESINRTLSKSTMTRIWSECNLLNRFSIEIKNKSQLDDIDNSMDIIVKPNLCSGSRGITIIKAGFDKECLLEAYNKAIEASWDEEVVVEEFVTGTEYTVEMLGDSYGNVEVMAISKKYHTHHTVNNSVAVKLHYNPSDVSEELLLQIADAGRECYKALGLSSSMGHLELIVAEDGRITPLEIGARSSGYIASHCVDAVIGDDFFGKFVDVINGGKVTNTYAGNTDSSSMLFFYDMPVGHTVCDGDISEFLHDGIDVLAYNRDRIKAGMDFKNIDGDGERYGFEVLAGKKDILTIENVVSAEEALYKKMYNA